MTETQKNSTQNKGSRNSLSSAQDPFEALNQKLSDGEAISRKSGSSSFSELNENSTDRNSVGYQKSNPSVQNNVTVTNSALPKQALTQKALQAPIQQHESNNSPTKHMHCKEQSYKLKTRIKNLESENTQLKLKLEKFEANKNSNQIQNQNGIESLQSENVCLKKNLQTQTKSANLIIDNLTSKIGVLEEALENKAIAIEEMMLKMRSKSHSREEFNKYEKQIDSLRTKIEYYENEDEKIRKKVFEKILKIKDNEQSRRVSVFSLMENTIIEIVCNLQEIGKEICEVSDFMKRQFALNQKQKKDMNLGKQNPSSSCGVYNHWAVLGRINEIKEGMIEIGKKNSSKS